MGILLENIKQIQWPATILGCLILAPIMKPATAWCHPVVFAEGTAVMGHQQGEMSEFEIVHSPNARTGVGLNLQREKHSNIVLGKASALLWRGNYPDYQSNLYFGLGAGQHWSHESNAASSRPLFEWNAEWDGEDRQIYSLVSYSESFEDRQLFRQRGKVRMGFAPYKAQNDELTLWGILQWSPEKMAGHAAWKHEVTPLVRLFYKNALIELGSSLNGTFTFNYMFHFFN